MSVEPIVSHVSCDFECAWISTGAVHQSSYRFARDPRPPYGSAFRNCGRLSGLWVSAKGSCSLGARFSKGPFRSGSWHLCFCSLGSWRSSRHDFRCSSLVIGSRASEEIRVVGPSPDAPDAPDALAFGSLYTQNR